MHVEMLECERILGSYLSQNAARAIFEGQGKSNLAEDPLEKEGFWILIFNIWFADIIIPFLGENEFYLSCPFRLYKFFFLSSLMKVQLSL